MIEERIGDLFAQRDLPALAHGCNLLGVWGAGIAREFRRLHPDAFAAYRAACRAGEFGLGDVAAHQYRDSGRWIYSLGTQPRPGPCADPAAIECAVRAMCAHADAAGVVAIGLPRIGAGLGGLSWAAARAAIARGAGRARVRLVVCALPEPAPRERP